MGKVLVSTDLPGKALDALRALHDVEVGAFSTGLGKAGLLRSIGAADALVTIVSDLVDEEVLVAAPRLRIVANCGVGTDNVDLQACRRRGIIVTNTPDVLTEATADLTFALVLDACRRVSEGDRLVRAGLWTGFSPTLLLGMQVHGSTLGVVGFGRIGRAVARRAKGFSMRVLYTQRHRLEEWEERELGAAYRDLDGVLEESDIVCLCCPLTSETRGLMNAERIGRMKKGAVLVNTARGACIDDGALVEALRSGHLFAAGLDVFSREPAVPEPLVGCERAVLAPHIGSADRATREQMAWMCAEAVLATLRGEEPRYRVV